jgi:hypothetical protein
MFRTTDLLCQDAFLFGAQCGGDPSRCCFIFEAVNW